MNEKTMKRIIMGVLMVAIMGIPLGCSIDRWAEVEPGEYAAIDVHSESNGLTISGIEKLIVERESNTITIKLQDGSQVVTTFVPRNKQDWPAGCPSNIGSTRMEVLDIQNDNLSIGGMTFSNPILVRNCPPEPNIIIIREDGNIGGGGSACAWPGKDIHFSKKISN